jgi:hypothetical protein
MAERNFNPNNLSLNECPELVLEMEEGDKAILGGVEVILGHVLGAPLNYFSYVKNMPSGKQRTGYVQFGEAKRSACTLKELVSAIKNNQYIID